MIFNGSQRRSERIGVIDPNLLGLALEIRRSWSKLDLTTEDACLSSLKHGGLFVTETLSLDICPAVKWIWEKFFSNHSEEFPASVLVWVCSYLLLLVSLSSFFPSSLSPYHPANHSSSLPLPEHGYTPVLSTANGAFSAQICHLLLTIDHLIDGISL